MSQDLDQLEPTAESLFVGIGGLPDEPINLQGSRCVLCGRVEFPVRRRCPDCNGTSRPIALSSRGTVGGFTTVSAKPPGGLIEPPYTVVVAELEEGISILGPFSGVDTELTNGIAVESIGFRLGNLLGYAFRRPVEENPDIAVEPGISSGG